MTGDSGAAYLRHLPAEVVSLSQQINDATLLLAWETIDAARAQGFVEVVEVPGVGPVEPAQLRTVWGWLVDVVKSRHADEWERRNDAAYDEIWAEAARAQGVELAAVDWDAVPDGVFDGKPTALDFAVLVLAEHAAA